MGFFSKFMASKVLSLFLLLLLIIPSSFQEEGFISLVISDKGLDFAKDLLIEKAISSIVPLQLPQIEKQVKVPIIGTVHVVLSNITIYSVDVPSSYVETGETGIVLIASGATANLSLNWKYSYSNWFILISDNGRASIQNWRGESSVLSMIKKKSGNTNSNDLCFSAFIDFTFSTECFCQVEGMDMGVTVALEDQEGTLKLSVLESGCYVKDISIKADYMHWIVDKVPDQSLLNTSKWKYAVPQLYKKYPDDTMVLNISISSPPIIKVVKNDIETTIYTDVIINVLDAAEVIPVACISLEITGSCSPKIVVNKLVGTLKLKDFTAVLKWSTIGDLHMHLVQILYLKQDS
ncbi:BPI fold-containing family B member [Parasponia andersonii]|uniref:BPI fold-containing family B member n=1 Tax=Parasponia andersonii TaxID=3476 RepID=A0A2P5AQB1_PARAD|nr:BPI fold-containing family B member [Parasponia andersonii]